MKLLGTYLLNMTAEDKIREVLEEKDFIGDNIKVKEFLYGHCDDQIEGGQKDRPVSIETFVKTDDNNEAVAEISFLTINKIESIYLYLI